MPPTPESEREGTSSRATTALAALVTCWLVLITTLMVGGDFWSQITEHHYQMPQFLIDTFVTVVNVAVGATSCGVGIGLAVAAIRGLENSKLLPMNRDDTSKNKKSDDDEE